MWYKVKILKKSEPFSSPETDFWLKFSGFSFLNFVLKISFWRGKIGYLNLNIFYIELVFGHFCKMH